MIEHQAKSPHCNEKPSMFDDLSTAPTKWMLSRNNGPKTVGGEA